MSALETLADKIDGWLKNHKRTAEDSGHVVLVEQVSGQAPSYGTAKSIISRWRVGRFPPGHLLALARLLEVTVDDLVEIIAGLLEISPDGVWGLARIAGVETILGRTDVDRTSWRELLAMVRGEA